MMPNIRSAWSILLLLFALFVSYPLAAAQPDEAPPNVTELIADLKSGEESRALRAAQALEQLGPAAQEATAELITALNSDDVSLRVAAARALGAIGSAAKDAIPALVARLSDATDIDNAQVWMFAADALGKMGKDAVPPLLEVLARDNRTVYLGVSSALHDIGPDAEAAVPALQAIVETNDGDIIPALYALLGIGSKSKEATTVLIAALDNADFHSQYWSCRVLGAIGADAAPAVPKLIDLLKNGVTSVRRNAAIALGLIGPAGGDPAIDALIEGLVDPLQFVRNEAVVALGKIGPPAKRAVPRIKELVESHPTFASRSLAAGAVWRIDPEDETYAMQLLLQELQADDSPWDAARELGVIAPATNHIEDVVTLLDSPNETAREYAVEALGWMGKAAEPWLSRLQQLAADDSQTPDCRQAAAEAIERIETAVEQKP